MGSSVVNGVIQRLSPSFINSFDPSTSFGCMRRGYFKYVLDKPEPTTGDQTVGLQLHKTNEAYLTNEAGVWTDLFSMGKPTLDRLKPFVRAVEAEVKLDVGGIPMTGYCDLITEEPGIWDWKTTSDIEKYGKTPGALAKDTQMILYARAAHPDAQRVVLAHGQYQTKGRIQFRETKIEIEKSRLDDHYGTVILPLVETIKEVVKATDPKDVAANRNACRMCPHKGYCPADKENPTMNFFKRYQTENTVPQTATVTTVPVSQVQASAATPMPKAEPAVLPPDAPASNPALAAKPIDGFSPVPAPRRMQIVDVPPASPPPAPTPVIEQDAPVAAPVKRGPGRPPGSKNKPKHEVVVAPAPSPAPAPTDNLAMANKAFEAVRSETPVVSEKFAFETVTVNYGATINTGNYNSVRFDVTMSARFSGDPEAAYQRVLQAVMEKVGAEVEKIEASVLPKATGTK